MPARDHSHSPARAALSGPRIALALVIAAGAAFGVGCETTQTASGRTYQPYESRTGNASGSQAQNQTQNQSKAMDVKVNTGLAQLSADREPPALIDAETPEAQEPLEAERVAASARLLDEYFTRLNEQTGGAIAGMDDTTAYDPSAEIGPTGSSRFATASIDDPIAGGADEGEIDIFAAPPSAGLNAMAQNEPATQAISEPISQPQTTPPAQIASSDPIMDVIGTEAPATSRPAARQSGAIVIEDVPAGSAPMQINTPATQPQTQITQAPVTQPISQPIAQNTTPASQPISQPTTTQASTPVTQAIASGAPSRPALGNDPVIDAIESELTGQPVPDMSTATASAESGFSGRVLTPEQRKQQLVDELVGLLQEIAVTGDEPYRSGLALAGLETLSPGALYSLTESGVLMPDEVRTLLAAHEMFSGLSAGGGATDAGRVSDLLADVKEKMDEHAPLKIPAAELCTRVMGFGQYDMFPKAADGSYTFRAGRRQPVIIYTEVDRFGRRPLVGDDGLPRWEVTLSQELEIYHDSDDLLVMARNAETDRSISRNKIRDYYLINQTYLPENLSVGRYNLKVIMRDANKQAVAESIIPFTIVAEESATIRGGS